MDNRYSRRIRRHKEEPVSEPLETIYRAYLEALNDRRLDDLDEFVHDELVYNDRPISRRQYARMLAEDVRKIPDLHFTADLLVTGDGVVACRLWFDCTPEHEFAGIEPTGRRASFAEHVFYRFREGRIEQVWSLVDLDALRQQMAPDTASRTP
jgi:predicted ester cyclase